MAYGAGSSGLLRDQAGCRRFSKGFLLSQNLINSGQFINIPRLCQRRLVLEWNNMGESPESSPQTGSPHKKPQRSAGVWNGIINYRFELQELDICFMEVMFSVGCALPPVEVLELPEPVLLVELPELAIPPVVLELDEDIVPLISTVCPTCSLSLEVSPASW
jgi:hypothetical protein